jgi:flagellar assembly factor FliW
VASSIAAVHVSTTRFGDLDIDLEQAFHFDEGLLGFPEAHRFALIDANPDADLYWLQSLEDGSLAFLATVPWTHFATYEPEISDDETDSLDLTSPDDASLLCLLTVDRANDRVSANLLGPVVINMRNRRAKQIVLHDANWPVDALLGEQLC